MPAYCSSPDYRYAYSAAWNYAPDGCRMTEGASSEIFSKSNGQAGGLLRTSSRPKLNLLLLRTSV